MKPLFHLIQAAAFSFALLFATPEISMAGETCIEVTQEELEAYQSSDDEVDSPWGNTIATATIYYIDNIAIMCIQGIKMLGPAVEENFRKTTEEL